MWSVIVNIISVLGALVFLFVLLLVHQALTRTVQANSALRFEIPGEEEPLRAPVLHTVADSRYSIEVAGDMENPSGRVLLLGGSLQGYSDLQDPTFMRFAHQKIFALLADLQSPSGLPIHTLSLGGGPCALARYVAATRPGSNNTVFEADDMVAQLATAHFGVTPADRISLTVVDAGEGVRNSRAHSLDVVFGDVFNASDATPRHLRTADFLEGVKRLLTEDGIYGLHIVDFEPFLTLRSDLSTAQQVFPNAALVWPLENGGSEEGGSFVLVMGPRLDAQRLERGLRNMDFDLKVLSGVDLSSFVAGTLPLNPT